MEACKAPGQFTCAGRYEGCRGRAQPNPLGYSYGVVPEEYRPSKPRSSVGAVNAVMEHERPHLKFEKYTAPSPTRKSPPPYSWTTVRTLSPESTPGVASLMVPEGSLHIPQYEC